MNFGLCRRAVSVIFVCVALTGCGPRLSDVERGIRQLPRRDRQTAKLQQTCPMTGSELGRNGDKPVKVELLGESLFVCCTGCASEVRSDLARLALGLQPPGYLPNESPADSERGLMVADVIEDSPADRAGVMPNDLIMQMNGVRIDTWRDANAALREIETSGARVSLVVRRPDEEMTLDVTLCTILRGAELVNR